MLWSNFCIKQGPLTGSALLVLSGRREANRAATSEKATSSGGQFCGRCPYRWRALYALPGALFICLLLHVLGQPGVLGSCRAYLLMLIEVGTRRMTFICLFWSCFQFWENECKCTPKLEKGLDTGCRKVLWEGVLLSFLSNIRTGRLRRRSHLILKVTQVDWAFGLSLCRF